MIDPAINDGARAKSSGIKRRAPESDSPPQKLAKTSHSSSSNNLQEWASDRPNQRPGRSLGSSPSQHGQRIDDPRMNRPQRVLKSNTEDEGYGDYKSSSLSNQSSSPQRGDYASPSPGDDAGSLKGANISYTISQDYTEGEKARRSALLADWGKKSPLIEERPGVLARKKIFNSTRERLSSGLGTAASEIRDQMSADLAPIKFKDAIGRKFSFPFHLCQTWTVCIISNLSKAGLTFFVRSRVWRR